MKKLIGLTISLAPSLAFAQQITDINSATTKFTNLGNTFVTILISISVIYIIWSVVRYLIAGGEDDRKKGRDAIIWGVVGLFVILSIWGLVNILRRSFTTDTNAPSQGEINRLNIPVRPSQ